MSVELNNLHTAIWIYDIDHPAILWANKAGLKLWHSDSLEELLQRDLKTDQSTAVKESLLQYQKAFKQGEVIQENWVFTPKGIEVQAFCQFSGIELEDGRMAMLVEATTHNNSYTELGSTTILSTYSTSGEFISGNPPFLKVFGGPPKSLNQLIHEASLLTRLLQSLSKEQTFEEDVLIDTLSGRVWFRLMADKSFHDSKPTILLHLYNIHERKTLEESFRKQAWTDPLTGLLNRRGLSTNLEQNILQQQAFTLFYIDLDGFKMVNDSLGHGLGDDVLIEVCNRLQQECLPSEILCRFGGDEFILITYPEESNESTAERCSKLLKSLSETYKTLEGRSLALSASIGISDYPKDGESMDRIITCADAAMYHAKKTGKKRWVEYQKDMELILKRSSLLAQKLATMNKDDELNLYYQPIMDVTSNKIISFEALIRWHDDEIGSVSPEEIIQIAEKIGLICSIEDWVLNRSLKSLKILRKLTDPNITMSVNISGLHFSKENFEENILQILRANNLEVKDLTIELTESILLTDISSAKKALDGSKIRLSIDDFGTGYSSLAYLHNIPASTVKVDKSFLDNMFLDNMELNTVTLECIHRLVNALNMDSLIEGIETEEQAEVLKSLGYYLQQGYLHGRPQPIEYYIESAIVNGLM